MKRLLVLAGAVALVACGDTGSARKAVEAQLKDPSSAQFKDIRRIGEVVCGAVNSKNSFGAYAGFVRFYVVDGQAAILEPEESGQAREYFEIAFNHRCQSPV